MKDKIAEFFRQAAFYRYHDKFQRRERDYKLRLASSFSRSRELLNSRPRTSLEILRKAFTGKDNNIVDWRDKSDIVSWMKRDPAGIAVNLRKLWKTTNAIEKRFASFSEALADVGVKASGAQLAIGSTLSMTLSACDFPPVKVGPFARAMALLDWNDIAVMRRAVDRYLYALLFLDHLISKGREFDVELRDRLDAQGVVWCVSGGWPNTKVPVFWRNDPVKRAKAELMDYSSELSELDREPGSKHRGPTQKLALVKARRGQGKFRDGLIELWGLCAVTDCQELNVLRASHILPWKLSSDIQRLDKYNGLLLSPNLDAAFDGGLITFGDDGKIVISKTLSARDRKALGIRADLRLRTIAPQHFRYLDYHRKRIFEKGTGL